MIRGHKGEIVVACMAIWAGIAMTASVSAENPKPGPPADGTKTGQILGSFMTGGQIWSSPVHADGTVYVGSSDALTLFAFDGATGKLKWKYRTGGWSWGTPTVAGETVYIGSISAFPYYFEGVTLERGLHAVDRETGKRRWVEPTAKLPGFVTGGVMSTPLVVDGKVIAGALDNRLIVLSE